MNAPAALLVILLVGCHRPRGDSDTDAGSDTSVGPYLLWDHLPIAALVWEWPTFDDSAGYDGSRVFSGGAAFDAADGTVLWRLEEWLYVRYSAYGDGRVYATVDGQGGGVFALDPETGERLWRVSGIPGDDFAPTAYEGDLYLRWRVDGETGATLWADTEIDRPAAIDAERVYAYTYNSEREPRFAVSAISRETGERLWDAPTYFTPGKYHQPVVDGDRVYAAVDDGTRAAIVALDAATGAELWRFDDLLDWEGDPAYRAWAGPAVAHGTVYARRARQDMTLVALDADTGALRWWRPNPVPVDTSYNGALLSVHDGEIYVSGEPGAGRALLAFDASTGDPLWSIDMGRCRCGPPIITETGDIVLADFGAVRLFRRPDL